MIAENCLSPEIFPLKKSDSCESARIFMSDWGVTQLPVVDNNKVIGVINLADVLEHSEEKVSHCIHTAALAFINEHIFDLLRKMTESGAYCLPVVDLDQNYKGVVTFKEVINILSHSVSLNQPGGIIRLHLKSIDYSLAELSRISEYNDVKIIGCMVNFTSSDSDTVDVLLKFNKTNLDGVIAAFERHGKSIIYSYGTTSNNQELTQRFDWLMKYIHTK